MVKRLVALPAALPLLALDTCAGAVAFLAAGWTSSLACRALAAWLAIVNLSAYLLAWSDKRIATRRGDGAPPPSRRGNPTSRKSRRRGDRALGRRRHPRARQGTGLRVPERTFFLAALLGGGIGAGAAFLIHRHKTRKRRFLVPFWAATVVGAAAAGAAVALCV